MKKQQRQPRKATTTKRSTKPTKASEALSSSSGFVEEQYEMVIPESSIADAIPFSADVQSGDPLANVSHDILMLLSTYIDGELSYDPERLNYVEYLLDSRADVRDAFSRLKQLQSNVSHVTELTFDEMHTVMPDCWDSISRQLDADADFCKEVAVQGESASPEFLSAYYDNELPRKSPGVKAFEAQLGQDAKATKTLSDWLALSQLLKGYIYRLEEACGVDVTDTILSHVESDDYFVEEQAPEVASKPYATKPLEQSVKAKREKGGRTLLSPETAELLSAYFDNDALNPKEKNQASQYLETKENCRQFAIFHQQLREGLNRIVQSQYDQAPHILPSIKNQIFTEFPAKKQSTGTFPIPKKWVTAAALVASVLLVVVAGISSLGLDSFRFGQPSDTKVQSQVAALSNNSAQAVQTAAAGEPMAMSEQEDADGVQAQEGRSNRRYASRRYRRSSVAASAQGASNQAESEGIPFALPGGGFTTNASSYIIHSNPVDKAEVATSTPVEGNGVTFVSTHNSAGTRAAFSSSSPSTRLQAPGIAARPAREARVANTHVPSSESYLIDTIQKEEQRPAEQQDDVHVLYDL